MGSGLLGVGISALSAAQANLRTTSHNIANVDTPGFSRQRVIQTNNTPTFTGAGFIGTGVHVATVERVYSQFLVSQSLQTQTRSSQLDTYSAQMAQINNMLADTSAGLSPALQNFFSAVQDVATNPASIPSRQALLNNSDALVTRFNAMDQRLAELREGVNLQLTASVNEINSLAQGIAELNIAIAIAEGLAGGQPANDLLDNRDAMVTELGKLINVSTIRQNDGSQNILFGNGQPLVIGNQAIELRVLPSPDDPRDMTIGLVTGSNTILIPEQQLQGGGSVGGLLAFRNETLDSTQNALGRIAIGLAQTFNDQHHLGQDLNGNLGSDFFSVPKPEVIPATGTTSSIDVSISDVSQLTSSDYRLDYDGLNYSLVRLSDNSTSGPTSVPFTFEGISINSDSPGMNAGDSFIIQPTRNGAKDISLATHDTTEIAAAAPIRTNAALANIGTATISAGSVDPSLPVNANLRETVTITFTSPTQFNVTGTGTGAPTNQPYTAGDDISFNGFTIQINGTPAAGDFFTIEENINGDSDNRNALLLGQLQAKNTLIGGGSATYQSTYGQLVSQIGNKARELDVTSRAQSNLLAQTNQSLQSLSGVNLDEEAANLLRYQQAFQASSKVIEISNTLFDTLLRI